jgi:type II secretory pathway pseudopilin PulG
MKKGQVWVETVLYTLIILSLIGLVLAFVSPRIQQERDKIVVEQTIGTLNAIDEKISAVLEGGQNNLRIVEVGLRRGELYFDSTNNRIFFVLKELKEPYTEPGSKVNFGKIEVYSEEGKREGNVTLTLDYSTVADLTFSGDDTLEKKFSSSSVPYRFSVENQGQVSSLFDVVDIDLVS